MWTASPSLSVSYPKNKRLHIRLVIITLLSTFFSHRTVSSAFVPVRQLLPLNTLPTILPKAGGSTLAATARSATNEKKVLLLGGTGFLGSSIATYLETQSIPFVSTSTAGGAAGVSDSNTALSLDVTSSDWEDLLSEYCKGCTAVISTVGTLGHPDDEFINGASGRAAQIAKEAGVELFVFIGNTPKIRALTKLLPPLHGYAAGKERSEQLIRETFGENGGCCIVRPAFIYGGDSFSLDPPRVPEGLGRLLEEVLGLYPLQSLADALPEILGATLEVPVHVGDTAKASVHAAMGLVELDELDGHEDIVMAASLIRPPPKEVSQKIAADKREELKSLLLNPSSSAGSQEDREQQEFQWMEELEHLRPSSTRPAYDPSLNGRWKFVFTVEPDLGTGIIKSFLEDGTSPLEKLFALKGVTMEIGDSQQTIRLLVSTKVLGREIELVIATSIEPATDDKTSGGDDGTLFFEKFEGIQIAGKDMPIPEAWKRKRYIEISYLDDDIFIVRGNGKEPHFLVREKASG